MPILIQAGFLNKHCNNSCFKKILKLSTLIKKNGKRLSYLVLPEKVVMLYFIRLLATKVFKLI